MLKEQADQMGESLLQPARARQASVRVPDCPELRAFPVERRAAVWREVLDATRWDWPVVVVVLLVVFPGVAILVMGALSLKQVSGTRWPVFVCLLAPLGVLVIRQVHTARARWVLRAQVTAVE